MSRQGFGCWRQRCGLVLAPFVVFSACSGPPETSLPLQELPASVEMSLDDFHEARLDEAGRFRPVVLRQDLPVKLCLLTPSQIDTSQWLASLIWSRGSSVPDNAAEKHFGASHDVFAPPTKRMGATLCFEAPLPLEVSGPLEVSRPFEDTELLETAGPQETPVPSGFSAPLGQTDSAVSMELCGRLQDAYSGDLFDLGCHPVDVGVQASGGLPAYEALRAQLNQGLRQASELGLPELLRALEVVRNQALELSFPLLAVRIDLIAVHFLRQEGSDASLVEADHRLEQLPEWIVSGQSPGWSGQVAYTRAMLALDRKGDLQEAWAHLDQSQAHYARVGYYKTVTTIERKATILARIGVLDEARDLLGQTLADCKQAGCEPSLVAQARASYAWWSLQLAEEEQFDGGDVGSSTGSESVALEGVEEILDEALALALEQEDPVSEAIAWVNRAFLERLQGKDPSASLAEVRQRAQSAPPSRGMRQTTSWATLIEGLVALKDARFEESVSLCERVAEEGDFPPLAAWGRSCAGRAHRRAGRIRQAFDAFQLALDLHEHTGSDQLGQVVSISPSEKANDYYRASRVAVELGDPAKAWEILQRLDRFSANEHMRRRCDSVVDDRESALRADLLAKLVALELPAAGPRRRQRQSIRQGVLRELQELERATAGCWPSVGRSVLHSEVPSALHREPSGERRSQVPGSSALQADPAAAALAGSSSPEPVYPSAEIRFRAFALADETLLLERSTSGVELHKRTNLSRSMLRKRLALVNQMMAEGASQAEWIAALEPISQALTPAQPEALESATVYALHGDLQSVPMAALPIASEPATLAGPSGPRWLSDLTTVVLAPVASSWPRPGAPATASAEPFSNTPGLFVVDPTGNLAHAEGLSRLYASWFSKSSLLVQEQARSGAVLQALEGARWIHVDAHGRYDPAFPELSSLVMADGFVGASDLMRHAVGLTFANLSACETGRWPTTADSGRYGLAGSMVRAGAQWAIASRTELQNEVAVEFNTHFYRKMAANEPVEAAFAFAHAQVRERFSASGWAPLVLLSGGFHSGGQNAETLIPNKVRSSSVDQPSSGGDS